MLDKLLFNWCYHHPITYIIITNAIPSCVTIDSLQHPHLRYTPFLVNMEIWQIYLRLPSILNKHKFMSSLMVMRMPLYRKIGRATGMCVLNIPIKLLNRMMISIV